MQRQLRIVRAVAEVDGVIAVHGEQGWQEDDIIPTVTDLVGP